MGVVTRFVASDLVKVKGTGDRLKVQLVTGTGVPVAGVPVTLTVNGVGYDRTTDSNGGASLAINLDYGSYTCSLRFNGDSQYNASTGSVNVRVRGKYVVTISTTNPYSKTYGQPGGVTAVFYEEAGNPAKSLPVQFTINGVSYNRTTDSKGEARLNINLRPGEYDLKTSCLGDDKRQAANIHTIVRVKSDTHIIGQDMVKMEDELKVYECSVLNVFNERLTNVTVRFTVNGVQYSRLTDGNGVARLNIRLPKGEYDILVEYLGSRWYNPSSRSNHITSKPYMQSLTTAGKDGLTYPGNNIGFMESHIYTMYWDADKAKAGDWRVVLAEDISKAKDTEFTSYEITETDPRVKTAKFTSPYYMDLTRGRHWVIISSPYHENFGGQILKVDYDKNTGLYTYQCQDGRRQYQTKIRSVGSTYTIYEHLENWLIFPNMVGSSLSIPMSKEARENAMNKRLLSGLHPLEHYEGMKSGAVKFDNKFKEPSGEFLSFDSLMNNIMNFSHAGGFPTDVYFTPDGVCHIDPVDLDTWLKSGFKLTHSDLVQYKYGFDTTNTISAVGVKSNTGGMKWYGDSNIQWYFGYTDALIDATTTQTTTNASNTGNTSSSSSSSSASTGSLKGKPIVIACDTNTGQDSNYLNTAINTLQNAGWSVENLGIGPGAFSRYDWSGKSKGKIGIFIIAASTVAVADAMAHQGFDYCIFGIRGDIPGTRAITGWDNVRWGRDSDCTSVCNKWAGHTSQEISDMMGSHGCLIPGNNPTEMANNLLAAVNGERVTPSTSHGGSTPSTSSNTSNNTTTTTTVVDEVATYQKALEELSKSARGMLSFEIRLPLNDPMFKNLHTNQFLWTELPREFQLTNLAKIFKLLPTYKVNRGVTYMENRWYIEKNVIKCDSNGLFSTLTLNPFPSSYSSYANAVKGYLEAYNQAFKQQQAQTTTGSTTTGTGTITGSTGVAELDNLIKGWIAGKSSQYDIANAVHQGLKEYVRYASYSCSRYGSVAKCWANVRHLNCADISRLTRASMSTAGLEARVVHHSGCDLGHFWTQVKIDGKWVNSDLVGAEGAKSWRNLGDVWCTSSYDRVCGDNPSC